MKLYRNLVCLAASALCTLIVVGYPTGAQASLSSSLAHPVAAATL